MSTKKLKFSKKSNQDGLKIRPKVHFSVPFKQQKVKELLNKQTTIREISDLYGVSRSAVYKWIYKYSPHHEKGTIQVVQMESEAAKTKLLQSRLKESEAMIGRQQLKIDYLEQLIELASKELGYDLKKNYAPQPSNGFGSIEPNTITP